MRYTSLILTTVMILGLATAVEALRPEDLLQPQAAATLPEEAFEVYNQAVSKVDRVNYSGAVEDLARAAELAPKHIELQFLVAKLARYQAENTYGEDTLRFYGFAESALRRLLSNPALGPVERGRAQRESERVREGKDGQPMRDDARFTDGFELVLRIRDERIEQSGLGDLEDWGSFTGTGSSTQEEEAPEDAADRRALVWSEMGAPGLAESTAPVVPAMPAYGAGYGMGAYGGGYGGQYMDPMAAAYAEMGYGAPAPAPFDPMAAQYGMSPGGMDPMSQGYNMGGGMAPDAPYPYGAPAPGYGAPAPGYGAPAPGYGAPAPGYGTPQPQQNPFGGGF